MQWEGPDDAVMVRVTAGVGASHDHVAVLMASGYISQDGRFDHWAKTWQEQYLEIEDCMGPP